MSLHLYEITAKFKELESLAEHDDLPLQIVADTLEGIDSEWEEKAIAVAAFIKNLEHTSGGIAEAAKAMAARAARLNARADSLKNYLQFQMQVMDKKKIESDLFVIRRQNNAPSVVVADERLIPDTYWYQPPTPPKQLDKKAIAADIKAGKEVPGTYTSQGEHIRIES
jgi:hypothetical protein